jgi:hypothetical protein
MFVYRTPHTLYDDSPQRYRAENPFRTCIIIRKSGGRDLIFWYSNSIVPICAPRQIIVLSSVLRTSHPFGEIFSLQWQCLQSFAFNSVGSITVTVRFSIVKNLFLSRTATATCGGCVPAYGRRYNTFVR